jgi:cysteine-rich repeat protein
LPCGPPFDTFHPANGSGICLDDFSSCNSNDDCAAADCGLYCHCGFCDAGSGPDPDQPCFGDQDCDAGSTCASDPSDSNLSQAQPNGCESLVCGEVTPEECCTVDDGAACANPTSLDGECNGNPNTCASNSECSLNGNGDECIFTPRPCFDSTIARQGVASPLGNYCVDDPLVAECNNNSDCAIGECVPDSSEPTTAALFCIPATASPAITSAAGTPGPGAIEFRTALISCRCGDDVVGCDEECDDGNNANGDGCDQACRME